MYCNHEHLIFQDEFLIFEDRGIHVDYKCDSYSEIFTCMYHFHFISLFIFKYIRLCWYSDMI